jgi:hypothetical protein
VASSSSKRPIEDVKVTRASLEGKKIPQWAVKMKNYLLHDMAGSEWLDAVDSLVRLEAFYGFKTHTKTLPTTHRPSFIGPWVNDARKDLFPTLVQQVPYDQFLPMFKVWWNDLQPEWGRYERGDWKRWVEGDWGSLRCPGNNGMYTVMAFMSWWLRKHQNFRGSSVTASPEWKLMLSDVVWVMDKLQTEESATKKPQSS